MFNDYNLYLCNVKKIETDLFNFLYKKVLQIYEKNKDKQIDYGKN